MFKSKEFIGISYNGESVSIARVQSAGKKLHIVRLDKLKLVKPIVYKEKAPAEPDFDLMDEEDTDADSIFGLEDDEEIGVDDSDDSIEEIDLSDIEDDTSIDTGDDLDLADEAYEPQSNEELIFNYLSELGNKKKEIAVNIPSGDTVFQINTEGSYSEMKKKELKELVENKIHAIYGELPNKDHYDYRIREDNSLIIGSTDRESPMLSLILNAKKQYDQNYFITDVVADESVLVGLYKTHYETNTEEITGLLQIGPEKCRMLFMLGSKILQISPVINEGFNKRSYLNTIFSKILFQLDTGEIPGIDRLIIFNNPSGNKTLDFFRTSFSDLAVENFSFDEEKVEYQESLKEIIPSFTTAIGVAAVAARSEVQKNVHLSFLPDYVADQQKIFKLQWHGFVLLLLIGISPVLLNYFYQQNVTEIDQLQLQSDRLNSQISNIEPAVQESESLTQSLNQMDNQLTLLTDLSENNIRWTVTIDTFNGAVNEVGNIWINSFRQNNDVLMVDGFSTQQRHIPELARKFSNVTLLNVRKQQIRDRDIYFFTMMIREVIDDKSRFTPQSAREFKAGAQ